MSKKLVITVHGIRTFGQWQERLAAMLEQNATQEISVENYHYGYFSVIAFLIPIFRWLATRRFRQELQRIVRQFPEHRISIVAHSFGTHLVGWGLMGIPRPKRPHIENVILAGSVLRSGFPWGELLDDGSVRRVINECGTNDNVLILSQVIVLMTGMAGRLGFTGMTSERLMNRFFGGGHSHYFLKAGKPDDQFMAQHWIPLLALDETPQLIDERAMKGPLQGVVVTLLQISDPIKFTAYFGLVFSAFLYFYYFPKVEAHTQRERAEVEAIGREGQVAMRMLDSEQSPELALAALGHATTEDQKRAKPRYPGFLDVLSYWLPTLTSINDALSEIATNKMLKWRGHYYLKTKEGLHEVPTAVDYYAVTKDGLLLVLNSKREFVVFKIPTHGAMALQKSFSVPIDQIESEGEVDGTNSSKNYLLSEGCRIDRVEFYYFPESQRVILAGRKEATYFGGQVYSEVWLDLSGKAQNPEQASRAWSSDSGCNRYFDYSHQEPRIQVNRNIDRPRTLIQSVCGRYLVGEKIEASWEEEFGIVPDINKPIPFLFPRSTKEILWWEASHQADPADLNPDWHYEDLPQTATGKMKVVGNSTKYYLQLLPTGKHLVVALEFAPHIKNLWVFVTAQQPDFTALLTDPQSQLLDFNGFDFSAFISQDSCFAVFTKEKSPDLEMGIESGTFLISLTKPEVRELRQAPDEVLGGTFDRGSTRVALVGQSQVRVLDVSTGNLLWQTALPPTNPIKETRQLFESAVPVFIYENLLVTQYGTDALAAFSLSNGDRLWVSGQLGGLGDGIEGRVQFALSNDGSTFAAFNTKKIRLISTMTGTFLNPLTAIESIAKKHRRPLQPIREVSFDIDGSLLVDAGSSRFKRRSPLTKAQVLSLLPQLEAYTSISGHDGKTLIQVLLDRTKLERPK